MKDIVVLGSTGSIGTQTLEVLQEQPQHFRATGLVAGGNASLLIKQALQAKPKWVGIKDAAKLSFIRESLPREILVVAGDEAIEEMVGLGDYQVLLAAISGIAGLKTTMIGIQAGKDIALANKETLVAGGEVIMKMVAKHKVQLLPVDSEHSAIFQCLGSHQRTLKKIILTASGGPFRDYTEDQMSQIRLADALQHPNWSMGRKITIDSATLANKALEVIEAHHLFQCSYDQIEVLIHKESIVHSLVEFIDTSLIAQLGYPSMKLPILYALSHPKSLPVPWPSLDLAQMGTLHFSAPNPWFKALKLGIAAGREGGSAPVVFNGANEMAVALFLEEKIGFLDIADFIEGALESITPFPIKEFEDIVYADERARAYVIERSQQ